MNGRGRDSSTVTATALAHQWGAAHSRPLAGALVGGAALAEAPGWLSGDLDSRDGRTTKLSCDFRGLQPREPPMPSL